MPETTLVFQADMMAMRWLQWHTARLDGCQVVPSRQVLFFVFVAAGWPITAGCHSGSYSMVWL